MERGKISPNSNPKEGIHLQFSFAHAKRSAVPGVWTKPVPSFGGCEARLLWTSRCRTRHDFEAAAIAGMLLRSDTELESLNLTNQHPGECGGSLDLSLLGLALVSNDSLRDLDVSFNMLSSLDIQSLVASLAKNSGLRSLNLMKNALNDDGIRFIGKYLPRMKGLEQLDIMANRFSDVGSDAILEGLQMNVILSSIEMPRGYRAANQIDHLLNVNKGGRRLLGDDTGSPPCPPGLWNYVFARVNKVNKIYSNDRTTCASVLFHLLHGTAALTES